MKNCHQRLKLMSSQTGVIFHILGNDWKPPKAPSITNNLLNYIIPHISTNTNMQKAITTLIYRGEKVKKKNWLKIYIKSHYIDFFYIYVCICMCISRSRALMHTQIRIHMWSFFFFCIKLGGLTLVSLVAFSWISFLFQALVWI